MSELSAAAAEALGIPEAIVMRSAAARATETGMTVDDVLQAWAGGEAPPAGTAPPATEASPDSGETPPDAPPEEEAEAPTPTAPPETETVTPLPAAMPATTVSGRPPVLVGKTDNPLAVLIGAVALFAAVLLVGLVGPALPTESPGARSSELPFTESAERGHQLFLSTGCAACHTQLVRPVVADVGLGAVTLNDSNQVLGTRRFGPDLSDVGTRLSGSQIEATVTGFAGHPGLRLSRADLDDLVAYLTESKTSVGTTEGAPAS